MKPHWQQSHLDLYDIELEPAYYRALARFPDRLEDIKAVFDVTDALRVSLIRLDEIAFKNDSSFGAYCIEQIDNLHTDLWHDREFFDTLSHQSRALFTWREQPVEWRGKRASNIVELIRNEAMAYSWILLQCSSPKLVQPNEQAREVHPEPWFDIAAVQDVSRRIRERIPLECKLETPDKPGPEFTKRTDVRSKYFKVWAFVQKPGNAARTNAEIVTATHVHKDMVARILTETRPPKPEELEPKRTAAKKR